MHSGRIRRATRLLLLLLLGSVAGSAAGEVRYFRDWLASCDESPHTACRVSAFQLREGGPHYDYALRLERAASGASISLVFESTDTTLEAQASIEIKVDGRPATTVLHGGYRLDSRDKQLTVTSREAIDDLLPALRAGNRVYVHFTRAGGRKEVASFSLLGLTPALGFMRTRQQDVPGPASAPLPRNYRCMGQEPFWNLAIRGELARYSELGDESEGRELDGQTRSMAYLAVPTFAWRGRSANDTDDLVVFVTREHCVDTMADRPPYAYAARISLPGGDTRYGCCSAWTPPPIKPQDRPDDPGLPIARLDDKPAQDWSHQLLALMPAIRLCLERAPQDARTVITARTLDDGLIGVRLVNNAYQRYECVVDPQTARVARFGSLPPGSPSLPGEGMPLYRPASGEQPDAGCYDRERVVAEDGSLLGYLGYQTCFRAPQETPQTVAPTDTGD